MTTPELAVISTATENRINSPAPELIERLERNHINYYRTDRDGTIKLSTTGKGFTSSATGGIIQK
jgi:competence protein ComEC